MSFARIRPKRGTANQWTQADTILGEGELGFEVPNAGIGQGVCKLKMGDGASGWNSLPYAIDVINTVYPVGSIYMSTNATSPASLFGGTWERIKDTFLLSAGDTYNAGATGGEATHKLTVNEMPSHKHNLNYISWDSSTSAKPSSSGTYWVYNSANNLPLNDNYFKATGGNQEHNNMPPYLTVYMWKRTA